MNIIKSSLHWAPLTARVLIAVPFLLSGYQKITNFAGAAGYAQAAGVPTPDIAIIAAIVIEIVAGLSVLFGYRIFFGALALVGYTVLVSFIFHWNLADQTQTLFFMKNMGIVAALLYMTHFGAGRCSMDNK